MPLRNIRLKMQKKKKEKKRIEKKERKETCKKHSQAEI